RQAEPSSRCGDIWRKWAPQKFWGFAYGPRGQKSIAQGFPISAKIIVRRFDGRMAFVPEGQHDSSQARSAWNHEENSLVPAGRLNRSHSIQNQVASSDPNYTWRF